MVRARVSVARACQNKPVVQLLRATTAATSDAVLFFFFFAFHRLSRHGRRPKFAWWESIKYPAPDRTGKHSTRDVCHRNRAAPDLPTLNTRRNAVRRRETLSLPRTAIKHVVFAFSPCPVDQFSFLFFALSLVRRLVRQQSSSRANSRHDSSQHRPEESAVRYKTLFIL